MEYLAIRIVLSACLEAIYLRAVMLALRLRSNRLYIALAVVDFAIGTILDTLNIMPAFNALLGLAFYFTAPIILSVGALKTRIVRTVSLFFALTLGDMLGGIVYASLGGGAVALDHIGPDNASLVITTYLIIIFVSALMYEALLSRFAKTDENSSFFESSSLVLVLASTILYCIYQARTLHAWRSQPKPDSLPFLFAYCWISLLIIYLILWSAKREAAARRELADRAIVLRGVRHTRREVEAMARRAEGMRSLRHELANQVRTVSRLAGAGDADEARQRLEGLEALARALRRGE